MSSGAAPQDDIAAVLARLAEAERALAEGDVAAEARRATLEGRARALGARREAAVAAGEKVLAFAVGGERYAVPAHLASLVLEASALAPLLGAPPWLLGAVVARERVVPVVDLRPLLGLTGGGLCDLARVVVVERAGGPIGLAVEAVLGERDLARGDVAPATSGPFRWVAADRTALLEAERLTFPAEAR